MIHTSMPVDGKVSLGCEVNVMPAAIEACKAAGGLVLAQMNPNMPYTYGDGEFNLDVFDGAFEAQDTVATGGDAAQIDPARAESAAQIGRLVAGRI